MGGLSVRPACLIRQLVLDLGQFLLDRGLGSHGGKVDLDTLARLATSARTPGGRAVRRWYQALHLAARLCPGAEWTSVGQGIVGGREP